MSHPRIHRGRRASGYGFALAALLVAALARPAALEAQDVTLQSAGGNGGDPYSIGCGSKAMVGMQGRSGRSIAQEGVVKVIQALCVQLQADGAWIGDPAPGVGIAGVNEGVFTSLTCPRNHAVSGISGFALNGYVNTVSIWCAPMGAYGKLNGTSTHLNGAISGGLGATWVSTLGTPFGAFLCPDSKPGKGFVGRAHDWVDQIALVCNFPATASPAVKEIALSTSSLTGGGTLTGTLTLNAAAPAAGHHVTLWLNDASLGTLPINPVPFGGGQQMATFSLKTNAVTVPSTVSMTATPSVGAPIGRATLQPPGLKQVSLSASTVSGGGSATGTVELTGKAFDGGVALSLTSLNPAVASVPSAVVVPEAHISATFPVTTNGSPNGGCATIVATYNSVERLARLAIFPTIASPPSTSSKSSGPLALSGSSGSARMVVSFASASTLARTVDLTSSDPAVVTPPAHVEVPAGATAASFVIRVGNGAPGAACALLVARDGSGQVSWLVVGLLGSSIVSVTGP
jgi:hypothetical protein